MTPVAFPSAQLTGKVVALEPLAERHWAGVLAVGLAGELWRWTLEAVADESQLRRWFDEALAAGKAGTAVPFATLMRESGTLVGSTRFGNLDAINRRVEIGWTWVAPAWQRTAVNTEAKYLMLRHAFEVWDCHRVELKTDALNTQSRAAIRRIGAREEGVFSGYQLSQGGRMRDTVWHAVLRPDWPAVRSDLERRLSAPPPAR